MESARIMAKIFKYNLEEAITSRKTTWEYTCTGVEWFHKIKVGYIVNICPDNNYNHVIDDCKCRMFEIDEHLWYTNLWNDKVMKMVIN